MVAITVILAAVIAVFVFQIGGEQQKAPTASITVSNNPDTPDPDMKIQHKGGDTLKGGDWRLSIVKAGDAPVYIPSDSTDGDFGVGNQIIPLILTNVTPSGGAVYTLNNSALTYNGTFASMERNEKYDVKLIHIPSNAMLLDTVVEVR